MKYLILAATLIGFCATGTAFAQEADGSEQARSAEDRPFGKRFKKHVGKKAERMFSKLDANEDGQVDLNEFLANSEARFQRMDINGDGFVTLAEAKESHRAQREEYRAAKRARRDAAAEEGSGPS